MGKLRVGINGRVLKGGSMRGWTRYTLNLIRHLRDFPADIFVYHKEPLNPAFRSEIEGGNVHFMSYDPGSYLLWEQSWLAKRISQDNIGVFHCPIHFGLPYGGRAKKVLTLHDTIEGTDGTALLPRTYHALARRTADVIVTVSEYSRRSILQSNPGLRAPVLVIPEAAEESLALAPTGPELEQTRKTLQLPEPFFFYVGGWEERKNIDFLVRNFLAADLNEMNLLLAGGSAEEITHWQSRYPYKNIHWRGRLSDRQLAHLYRLSRGFVYPSLAEGFGLQVVEAFAADCAVIGSSTTSLGEIINNPEATFSPVDGPALRAILQRLASDDHFWRRLKSHGRQELQKYSWEKTVRQTFALYESLAESRQEPSPAALR